jgi:hypothetical protein
MRMKGGQAFTGKTTRSYPAGGVIDIDHPDYREAQIAGWVTLADEPTIKKGAAFGSAVAIADEADGHVLLAETDGRVYWYPAAQLKGAPDVPSASAV